MALIASISGIRGTIGGAMGDNLTPVDIVRFVAAYGTWVKTNSNSRTIVLGRDARPSGPMLHRLVSATLMGMGFTVLDADLATTPTVEMAVTHLQAAGGIILTASHNPVEWNALKLLNSKGEFLSAGDAQTVLNLYEQQSYDFAPVASLGRELNHHELLDMHLEHIINLPLVDVRAVAHTGLRVVVDAVNSVGGIAVPALLRRLGITDIVELYCTPNGNFPHNPEPLKEHLGDICAKVKETGAHMGIVVDPDVDRLAIIDEKGELIGEEYTLVAVADYVLSKTPGPVVNNLSSSRALRDVAAKYGQQCHSAAVGEVNVVETMKRVNAVLGGEGNGGIIYPDLHYGRDALVGIALFLTHLAHKGGTVSALRAALPPYHMSKQKAALTRADKVQTLLDNIVAQPEGGTVNTTDGVKIDFEKSWVHLRRSNTEPIVRIYAEAPTQAEADDLALRFKQKLESAN